MFPPMPRIDRTGLSEPQQKVRDLYRANASVREIADAMHISTQRVYQHLRRLRNLGELPDEEGAA